MISWKPISKSEHADKRWRVREDYKFVMDNQIAQVLLNELPKVLPQFVLGFLKKDDGYALVAVLGIDGKRNLYVNNEGKWLGNYVPAAFRGYPFVLANDEKGDRLFCIDEDYLTDAETGKRLFEENGELAPLTQQLIDFLKECDTGSVQTQNACKTLAEAALIEPWALTVDRGESLPPVNVEGLHRINEYALQTLESDKLGVLQKAGGLHLAYAQLYSMNQVEQLTQRSEHFNKGAQSAQAIEGVGELFADNDTLNFDNLKLD